MQNAWQFRASGGEPNDGAVVSLATPSCGLGQTFTVHYIIIIIIIIIHLFYKAPFKALKVAVQHIKNRSRMDTSKEAEQSAAEPPWGGTSQAEADLKDEFWGEFWIKRLSPCFWCQGGGGGSRGGGRLKALDPVVDRRAGGQSGRWRRPTRETETTPWPHGATAIHIFAHVYYNVIDSL